jgi:hypothetical protein
VIQQGMVACCCAVTAILLPFSLVQAQPIMDGPPRFSSMSPGQDLPAAWTTLSLPGKPATRFSLVADNSVTVMRADSEAGAGTLVSRFRARAEGKLAWRWKVDRVVDAADLTRKAGDDFAARLYVFFDVPMESLPLATRIKYGIVSLFYKVDLPTAALCYVWDNKHPVGHATWSAYTDRVRLIVLRNGSNVGGWNEESRDPAADFKLAFGIDAPAITGIAIGNDTDQTGERAVAHFSDVVLLPPAPQ